MSIKKLFFIILYLLLSLERGVAEEIKKDKKVFNRSRLERSIASEKEDKNKTKTIGYLFILSLPLFLGAWLMKNKDYVNKTDEKL